MFRKILSLVKQSAVYGLGTIAARAVAFLMLPYYSHLLPPSGYGIFTLFMIMIAVLQPLYVHGMDISFLRFSAAEGRERQNRDLGLVLVQTLLFGGTLSMLLYLFAGEVASLVILEAGPTDVAITRICAFILLADTLSYHVFTYLRIRNRAILFSGLKLLNVVLNIGLNVLFLGGMGLGVLGAFYAFLGSSLVLLVLQLILAARHLRWGWNWERVREWAAFGLPNVPSMLFVMAVELSDRKWIEAYLGADQAGIYSAGYRVGMLMNMVTQAFRYAWQPFFMQTSGDGDARETYARVLTYFLAFMCYLWLGATFFLDELLKLPIPGVGPLIDPAYWAGFAVFPIIMLAHIFNGIYANFMVGVYLKKRTIILPAVIGLAAVVNVAGNGLLVPIYGYMASAWLTVLSYAMIAAGIFIYIAPRYKVPYEWGRLLGIAASTAAAWALGTRLLQGSAALGGQALLMVLLAAGWMKWVLSSEERAALGRLLSRRR